MKITVKVTGDKKVYQSLKLIGESVDRIVNEDIEKQMNSALRELQRPGKPIQYPVNWDSERQRRAFFATDGFGRGIPYKRTGRYNRSFAVKKTGKGRNRSYVLINSWTKSKYVGGDTRGKAQSRIHAGRWPLIADVVRKFAKRLTQSSKDNVSKIRQLVRRLGLGL